MRPHHNSYKQFELVGSYVWCAAKLSQLFEISEIFPFLGIPKLSQLIEFLRLAAAGKHITYSNPTLSGTIPFRASASQRRLRLSRMSNPPHPVPPVPTPPSHPWLHATHALPAKVPVAQLHQSQDDETETRLGDGSAGAHSYGTCKRAGFSGQRLVGRTSFMCRKRCLERASHAKL